VFAKQKINILDQTKKLNQSNLKTDLSNKIQSIKKQEIKIIITKDSDYNDVVIVLKIMTDEKIYKLLKA
jgi:biopolymer transport protein ExbD